MIRGKTREGVDNMQNIRLNNPSQVKRLINRTINQLLSGEIETDKARCVGYLSTILLKSLEIEELENRLTEIEKQVL